MGAIAGRAFAQMFLHPLQHGGLNLERGYSNTILKTRFNKTFKESPLEPTFFSNGKLLRRA